MVYGAEAVLPCDTIHDSPRIRMYEEKEAELDRQDNLDALEEERDVAKACSAFYQQQARQYQSREVRAKVTILASTFYAYRRKRRTNSNPSGKVPSSLKKFSPVERTDCGMHPIITSSRTHGMQPDSEDSTPSARLYVRLLTSVNFLHICFFSLSFSLFLQSPKGLNLCLGYTILTW